METKDKICREIMITYNITMEEAKEIMDNMYSIWNLTFENYIQKNKQVKK